jgi:hypothetical protein
MNHRGMYSIKKNPLSTISIQYTKTTLLFSLLSFFPGYVFFYISDAEGGQLVSEPVRNVRLQSLHLLSLPIVADSWM